MLVSLFTANPVLGCTENGERRKLPQKTDKKYKFSFAWFGKEKGEEKKINKKRVENRMPQFSRQNWRENEQKRHCPF